MLMMRPVRCRNPRNNYRRIQCRRCFSLERFTHVDGLRDKYSKNIRHCVSLSLFQTRLAKSGNQLNCK